MQATPPSPSPRASAVPPSAQLHDAGPLVSIVTIFLDAEAFLAEAIDSVLAQTYAHWELLLVDDGSTDGSTAIALRYASSHPERVRYLEHPGHVNRGMSAARNLGLAHARGDYLAFLDADDAYLPGKLSGQVALMEALPEAGATYGATEYWHSWAGPDAAARDWIWSRFGVRPNSLAPPRRLLARYLKDGETLPSMGSLLVRRQALHAAGGFEESFPGLYEDQVFLAKLSLATSTFVSSECHDRYRQHPLSACRHATEEEVQRAPERYLRWVTGLIERVAPSDRELQRALRSALRRHSRSALARTPAQIRRLLRRTWRRGVATLLEISRHQGRLAAPGGSRDGDPRRPATLDRPGGRPMAEDP